MKTNSKTNFLRGGALALATMFLFTTTVVQPVQATSIVNSIRCTSIKLFSSASTATLNFSVAAMNAAFNLQLKLLQATWDLQDKAVSLVRSVSEQGFLGLLSVYSAITAHSASEKAAVQTYKNGVLNALNVLHTKIDAARAAYREDMLALVKAHQKALTGMVNVLVTTIKSATATALQNCSQNGVVVTLVATIASAKLKLAAESFTQELNDLGKALKLVVTRDKAFLSADVEYIKVSTKATGVLLKATLGWHKN